MSDAETRLRILIGFIRSEEYPDTATLEAALSALLTEHRAEVSSARDAALEEAAQTADGGPLYVRGVLMQPSERIRALQSTPAQVVPVAKVREVLGKAAATLHRQGYGSGIIRDITRDRGLPLDAEGAGKKDSVSDAECPVCHLPLREHTNDGRYVRQPGTGLVCFHAHGPERAPDKDCPECESKKPGPVPSPTPAPVASAGAPDDRCDWCGKRRDEHDAQGRIAEECGGFTPA